MLMVVFSGLELNVFVGTTLVDMYAKRGSLEDARRVFDAMPTKTGSTWSSLIAGHAHHGQGEEALHLFSSMQQKGMTADKLTFVAVLKACVSNTALQEGTQIHAQIVEAGLRTRHVCCKPSCGHVKCGDLVHARQGCGEMGCNARRICSEWPWCRSSNFMEVCHKMVRCQTTLCIGYILKACGTKGAIKEGRKIHSQIQERCLYARIDMYAKYGSLANAWSVFNSLAAGAFPDQTSRSFSVRGCAGE